MRSLGAYFPGIVFSWSESGDQILERLKENGMPNVPEDLRKMFAGRPPQLEGNRSADGYSMQLYFGSDDLITKLPVSFYGDIAPGFPTFKKLEDELGWMIGSNEGDD